MFLFQRLRWTHPLGSSPPVSLLFILGSGWFDKMAGTWAWMILNLYVLEETASLLPMVFDLVALSLFLFVPQVHTPTHYMHYWYSTAHLNLIFLNKCFIICRMLCMVSTYLSFLWARGWQFTCILVQLLYWNNLQVSPPPFLYNINNLASSVLFFFFFLEASMILDAIFPSHTNY